MNRENNEGGYRGNTKGTSNLGGSMRASGGKHNVYFLVAILLNFIILFSPFIKAFKFDVEYSGVYSWLLLGTGDHLNLSVFDILGKDYAGQVIDGLKSAQDSWLQRLFTFGVSKFVVYIAILYCTGILAFTCGIIYLAAKRGKDKSYYWLYNLFSISTVGFGNHLIMMVVLAIKAIVCLSGINGELSGIEEISINISQKMFLLQMIIFYALIFAIVCFEMWVHKESKNEFRKQGEL